MTRRKTIEEHLAPVPASIRRDMLENRDSLAPGAAAVIGRFFAIVKQRHEPIEAPGEESFRAAAASESTLATLLRALDRHAPDVSTAAARQVRAEWYARRPGKTPAHAQHTPSEESLIASWPTSWQAMYPSLRRSRIKASSRERYVASISRCAQIVNSGGADERLTFYTAYCLGEAFRAGESNVRPVTIANYLEGLIALGRLGGVDAESLDGMRYMREALRHEAQSGDKLKVARISDLMKKGGFEYIAEVIGDLLLEADLLPDHSARKELLLQTVACCAVDMNKPARTGDMSRWSIGSDLWREKDGTWHLVWNQGKTGRTTEAGELWPEIGEILDELILCGRPNRFIHMRYREVVGKNWLTLSDVARPANWPSERIKAALGVPSHDLRTLAADYMRRHDPENAARVISTHLGHGTLEAGDEYSTECESEAAVRAWQKDRQKIAQAV
ncbi:hypothetical protein [Actibacterium lipolyticum]|uniref:Tyr recombinase domain-containing protein n=1 Tax=Actibacterium lipolyticum TaxID=1524263 RepID=A0A238JZY7_9RHOB|nr:hypothetical protein [Actibacterium lipolyticum]SMX35266.1 hypothetical protein COL8621_01733 [Actibacterium lipolyticum]